MLKFKDIKKKSFSLLLAAMMFVPSFAGTGMNVYADAGTVTSYEKVSAAGSTVGRFTVNNILAFCTDHDAATPPAGTPITSIEESGNEALRKVLYYGYQGPEAQIEDSDVGLVMTTLAASIACGHPGGPSTTAWFNNVMALPNTPATFKVYMAHTAGNGLQDLAYWEYNPIRTGAVELYKVTADAAITDNNGCYSLAGAQYGLFSGDTQVATLTTDANGYARADNINVGNYTIREITASAGYQIDVNSYNISVSSGNTSQVRVSEMPTNDPVGIQLTKIDADTGESVNEGAASLAGAKKYIFTLKPFWHTLRELLYQILKKIREYSIVYSITLDANKFKIYLKIKDKSYSKTIVIKVTHKINVVSQEDAQKLADEGKIILTSDNQVFAKSDGTVTPIPEATVENQAAATEVVTENKKLEKNSNTGNVGNTGSTGSTGNAGGGT